MQTKLTPQLNNKFVLPTFHLFSAAKKCNGESLKHSMTHFLTTARKDFLLKQSQDESKRHNREF